MVGNFHIHLGYKLQHNMVTIIYTITHQSVGQKQRYRQAFQLVRVRYAAKPARDQKEDTEISKVGETKINTCTT